MRRTRIATAVAAVAVATAVLPALAQAATCTLPTGNNAADNSYLSGGSTQTFSGHFGPELNGQFVQIPFDVANGITGMKIRYCYAKSAGADDNPTLDLGVYGARPNGQDTWTMAERRGWSGSAVKAIGIGGNGYSPEGQYNQASGTKRKDYTPGYTTRAYKPGPIGQGKWAVELGAGWIDPDGAGVDWQVEVTTSTAAEWSNNLFSPDPYTPYTANPAAGWYTGDLHVHGEMEPGNAPMSQTFTKGFDPLASGGSGLDFMTIVDHNNDNSRQILGSYPASYPGKLIIPGVEVTTYNGHANSQDSGYFADFRMSTIYRWDDTNSNNTEEDGELTQVRGPIDPSSQFQKILDGGGWSQVNHPTIYQSAPSVCRGCAWNYSDQQTDFSKVSAIELQTGPAGLPANAPNAMNPFTLSAIGYYEHALATGAHVAAVGSSDDHQGGAATGITDSPVGRGATVVHAAALNPASITAAVRAGHTYVKPFGADAPDVELSATTPEGKSGIPGDSLIGSGLDLKIKVEGAASAARPGPYTLKLLRDGIEVGSAAVSGDSFTRVFKVSGSGRYSFELTRIISGENVGIEAYSTPVWFTYQPASTFSFGAFKANRKKGTATLKVKVASPGKVKLTGPGLNQATAKVTKKNQTVTLNLRPGASLKRKLGKKGSAKVKVKVTNTPSGGVALSKSKTVKLLGKKKRTRG